jgi:hypothetical protein
MITEACDITISAYMDVARTVSVLDSKTIVCGGKKGDLTLWNIENNTKVTLKKECNVLSSVVLHK